MEFFQSDNFMYIIRMLIACLCGMAIGLERKERSKEAGIRTHCVVSCAAALMMIISKYGFQDVIVGDLGTRGADSARIAAQVVSGVGFLGAGMIFVQRNTIKGLTTAAGVWATAGIGMAVGAGMYTVSISATVIILLAQILLHMNKHHLPSTKLKVLHISGVAEMDFRDATIEKMKALGINVSNISISKSLEHETKDYNFTLEIPININEEMIIDMFNYNCTLQSIE